MIPFKHSQLNPNHKVESSEIILNNGEKDLSVGSFTTILKPDSLNDKVPIISSIINAPLFQISVTFNPQNNPPRIVVLLGDAISKPKDKEIFEIPSNINNSITHTFQVLWQNSRIISLNMDSQPLKLFSINPISS